MKRLLFALVVAFAFAPLCLAGTRDLKQSTPVTIVVGPFVDSAGASTSPTVTGIDVTGYKNDGAAFTISPTTPGTSGNDMAHVDVGYFSLELTSTDTSVAGYLRLTFQISGSLIFHEDFNILPANIYDSRYGDGTTLQKVDVTKVNGNATAATNLQGIFDSTTAGQVDITELVISEGVSITTTDTNESAILATGNGMGHGISAVGGVTNGSRGLSAASSAANGYGFFADGTGTAPAIVADGLTLLGNLSAGHVDITAGMYLLNSQIDTPGLVLRGNGIGAGLVIEGGATDNTPGLTIQAGNDGTPLVNDAVNLTPFGTGTGIRGDVTGNLTGSVGSVGDPASIWNALTSGMGTTGSIGTRIVDNLNAEIGDLPPLSYFEALFEGAPTFAEAMDDHGYTTPRAEKIDKLAPSLLVSTTISGTPSSQTSFVLAAGPANDDALNGALVIVTNDTIPASIKKAVGLVKDYEESTKTVTLAADPGVFEFAAGDKVDVIAGGAAVPLWLSGP